MALREVEFLRYLADLLDGKISSDTQEPAANVTINVGSDGSSDTAIDPTEIDSALDRDDVFVPPLQAKLEMLKKLSGIEPKNQSLGAQEMADDDMFDD